jgi:hypothetical protein
MRNLFTKVPVRRLNNLISLSKYRIERFPITPIYIRVLTHTEDCNVTKLLAVVLDIHCLFNNLVIVV